MYVCDGGEVAREQRAPKKGRSLLLITRLRKNAFAVRHCLGSAASVKAQTRAGSPLFEFG